MCAVKSNNTPFLTRVPALCVTHQRCAIRGNICEFARILLAVFRQVEHVQVIAAFQYLTTTSQHTLIRLARRASVDFVSAFLELSMIRCR